jgi:hypothetical protein
VQHVGDDEAGAHAGERVGGADGLGLGGASLVEACLDAGGSVLLERVETSGEGRLRCTGVVRPLRLPTAVHGHIIGPSEAWVDAARGSVR